MKMMNWMRRLEEAIYAEATMDDYLIDAFDGVDNLPFTDWFYDTYDASVELLGCEENFEPTSLQLEKLRAIGIHRFWISYGESGEKAFLWTRGFLKWSKEPCSGKPSDLNREHLAIIKQLKDENARLSSVLRNIIPKARKK